MSVWLTIPSKRPLEEIAPRLQLWRERGYRIALWRDHAMEFTEWGEGVDLYCARVHYPGYAQSVNWLIHYLMQERANAEWFVIGGDDVEPDPNHTAEEIAVQCRAYFHGLNRERGVSLDQGCETIDTLGVMQPTGDRDFGDAKGPYIDRVAGSAWIGREFAKRVNKGNGPLWPAFTHMFVDQCLQEVAIKLGVFWQRQDLTHYHAHWGRPKAGEKMGHASNMPAFLKEANSGVQWHKAKRELDRLRADGFAECMPL